MAKSTLQIDKFSVKVPLRSTVSKSKLRLMVKSKVKGTNTLARSSETVEKRVQILIEEENLTCSVCLQLFLKPVLAQCGHAFCLSCAEDLAINKYCCSICHSHHPSYDLPASNKLQKLVNTFLVGRQPEGQIYSLRKKQFIEKQRKRSPGVLKRGMLIDFWNEIDLVWKVGGIQELNQQEVIVKDTKTNELFTILSKSHRISRLHYFTKEEAPKLQRNPFLRELPMLRANPFFPLLGTQQTMGSVFPMMYYLGSSQPFHIYEPWSFIYQPPGV